MRKKSLTALTAMMMLTAPAAFAQSGSDTQAGQELEQSSSAGPISSSMRDRHGAQQEARGARPHGMMQGISPRFQEMMNSSRMRGLALQTLFALMDADGDGTISLEEAQEFMAVATERVFHGVDADNDQEVTLEELRAFVQGR